MVQNNNGLIGIQNIIQGTQEFVEQTIIGFSEDLLYQLVERTPIDTGRAKASWRIGVNEYLESEMNGGNPPYVGGIEIEQRFRKRNRYLRKPRQGKGLSGFIGKGRGKSDNIVISSNVPYMARLNRGWSKQAPPFFVESTIDAVMAKWGLV